MARTRKRRVCPAVLEGQKRDPVGAPKRIGVDSLTSETQRVARVFGLFRKSPLKRLEKEREMLVTRAFHAQRNGNIRLYSSLTSEAEALREKIERLKSPREA